MQRVDYFVFRRYFDNKMIVFSVRQQKLIFKKRWHAKVLSLGKTFEKHTRNFTAILGGTKIPSSFLTEDEETKKLIFLKAVRESFLIQKISEPIRITAGDETSLPDIVLTDAGPSDLVANIIIPLGQIALVLVETELEIIRVGAKIKTPCNYANEITMERNKKQRELDLRLQKI